ncbi:MAG: DUF1553 domain-containing protein [Planctomycetes bacterium]|nr:DUF1553 domain-containing protein [Planctomycetota bacterium]
MGLRYLLTLLFGASCAWASGQELTIDFNRDIRPILSNACFKCHGPDANERKGGMNGLRLDTLAGATADQGGTVAIVPGHPEQSELMRRILSADPEERMPPPSSGRLLNDHERNLLKAWIAQGAAYSVHWSYRRIERPAVPAVDDAAWPKNPIDHFVAERRVRERMRPSEAASRETLIRRAFLDLTGLPPLIEDLEKFLTNDSPIAYDALIDGLLQRDSFGEHWAHLWLDLARYADSAGYADDPRRTIWGYRDYVIRALNANMPFDQFTLEQIAGDLLPDAKESQVIATAFHRNTLTNSEGGTDDEEFRNVAIVDRVNTTMAVWMGTTIHCAQCHNHKYDQLSQREYFQLFAFFNNTQDADRNDESPLHSLFSVDQIRNRDTWTEEAGNLERKLATPTDALREAAVRWAREFPRDLVWQMPPPRSATAASGSAIVRDASDQTLRVAAGAKTDTYSLELPLEAGRLTAVRIEALPDDALPSKGPGYGNGNFVVSKIAAALQPPENRPQSGRYVRVVLQGKQAYLHLAEVQVFQGPKNLATSGKATQVSTDYNGPAELAIDGNTDGRYENRSVSHTAVADDPWWEVDLLDMQPLDRIVVWNRTDNGTETRLNSYRVTVLNDKREVVWEQSRSEPPKPTGEFAVSGVRPLEFAAALADYQQSGFEAGFLIKPQPGKGWGVGGQAGVAHQVTLLTAAPIDIVAGVTLSLQIEQNSPHEQHTIGRFRLSVTGDERVASFARTPANILAILTRDESQRDDAQRQELIGYYMNIAPELQADRERLAALRKQLAELKPLTTIPIMKERGPNERRKTRIQLRGNFLDFSDEVDEATPAVFHPFPDGAPRNRLGLAHWLVDRNNPLTARVIVNRFWEQLFGVGIVSTSEEFGAQGELPSHPELLDWLASEFMESGWNVKAMLKLMVTSATYRQSSMVTPELYDRDPDNRLLARGPRFRMSAETIRDQALAVSGLLSPKMFGASVNPPQPAIGLSAAFGSGIDWATSDGEDRHRRGLYTTWRRSNPYPSMAAFDAPNREVCTLRRGRTNTPLQALVTLNDPVYIEAAQALARRIASHAPSEPEAAGNGPDSDTLTAARVVFGFRTCLARRPSDSECARLVQLYHESRARFAQSPERAMKMATDPLGPLPAGIAAEELAAWTVVSNVLLNLDELFMKR